MKIDIVRLSEDRELELREEWDPGVFDLNAVGLELKGPLKVTAWVKKDAGVMTARVQAEGKARLVCSRCAREFDSSLDYHFRLIFPIEAGELQQELDDPIREEVILAYPARILCRDDCRGLCPRCGADLNLEKCKCY
jgi:uncharacterized protein